MEKMNQPKTDYGTKGETGEKMPKMPTMGANKSERMVNGVGMSSPDGIGMRDKSHMGKPDAMVPEYNSGRMEGECYDHKRIPHDQGSMDKR